jgi:6-pyruvoyltetrahydropterin/6-carboxytetrahydropterin synthase
VTIKGEVNPETGYVVDLKKLSHIIRERVIEKLDHKNINTEVDFMKDQFISTENLAIGIWNELESHMITLGVKLHSVKIQETENNTAEYLGN